MAKDKLQTLAKEITASVETDKEERLVEDVQIVSIPLAETFESPLLHKPVNWTSVRMDFVMAPQLQSREALAIKYGVSVDELTRRSKAQHWPGERTRFRNELKEKVKLLAAEGLAINLVEWDRECLQAARLLLGNCLEALVNGAPVNLVHAAIATAQKVGLEALGRTVGDGSHPEAQDDAVKVLEDYALAISELTPTVLEEQVEVLDEPVEELPEGADPTKTPVHLARPGRVPEAGPMWVERK